MISNGCIFILNRSNLTVNTFVRDLGYDQQDCLQKADTEEHFTRDSRFIATIMFN